MVRVESSISSIEVREESGDERALEDPLLKVQAANFPAVFQSMKLEKLALGVVAELDCFGKILSKAEFLPLVTLEVPRLGFLEFVLDGLVLARWKNCL